LNHAKESNRAKEIQLRRIRLRVKRDKQRIKQELEILKARALREKQREDVRKCPELPLQAQSFLVRLEKQQKERDAKREQMKSKKRKQKKPQKRAAKGARFTPHTITEEQKESYDVMKQFYSSLSKTDALRKRFCSRNMKGISDILKSINGAETTGTAHPSALLKVLLRLRIPGLDITLSRAVVKVSERDEITGGVNINSIVSKLRRHDRHWKKRSLGKKGSRSCMGAWEPKTHSKACEAQKSTVPGKNVATKATNNPSMKIEPGSLHLTADLETMKREAARNVDTLQRQLETVGRSPKQNMICYNDAKDESEDVTEYDFENDSFEETLEDEFEDDDDSEGDA
jgi:hypothetical protein